MQRIGSTARPGYLELARLGELRRRVDALDGLLTDCTVCPRRCEVDRHVTFGTCATGAEAAIASWTPHFGEEPLISGRRGSGTVFLANCNLRCVFCQNHDISQRPKFFVGRSITDDVLASIYLELQDRGCHNINWVSPSHQVPQLVRALALAADRGLSLPIVFNSNAYDGIETLQLLDGVVDVYMPDLKYSDATSGALASRVPDYPEHARRALAEMYRQVGHEWRLGPDGTLLRGLLVRILVLPNDLAGVEESLSWITEELSPHVGISLMAQYYPAHLAAGTSRYPLLARTISAGEWARAVSALERRMAGDHHFIQSRRLAPAYYRPDFSDAEVPFVDIEDFV
jgi:putative pyruvate formate lyase activating enzyme